MKINLKDKKALIGGSSKGLGYAVAKQLAVCGAMVTLVSRNEPLLKKNMIELKKLTGFDHDYIVVDYNDSEGYNKIIDEFFKTNSIDILIKFCPQKEFCQNFAFFFGIFVPRDTKFRRISNFNGFGV